MKPPKRKQKVFDFFLYWNEEDVLLMRLSELNEYVTHFIILEFDINFKLDTYKEFLDLSSSKFDSFRDKIKHLKIKFKNYEEVFDSPYKNPPKESLPIYQKFFSNAFDEISNFLKTQDVDFEDIIMFSDVDEIPDFKDKDQFLSLLTYGPIILKSHNFVYTTNFYQENSHLGTQIYNYSMLLRNNNILFDLHQCKILKKKTLQLQYLNNGWHLSHFDNLENIVKKLNYSSEIHKKKFDLQSLTENIFSLLPLYDLQSNVKFKRTNVSLPKKIGLIDQKFNFKPKIHSYYFSTSNSQVNKNYDLIIKINYTDNSKEPFENKIDNSLYIYNVFLPKEVYYESSSFFDEYKMNDIKLVIQWINPLDDDLITIQTNNGIKEFIWSDIKGSLIYDLL